VVTTITFDDELWMRSPRRCTQGSSLPWPIPAHLSLAHTSRTDPHESGPDPAEGSRDGVRAEHRLGFLGGDSGIDGLPPGVLGVLLHELAGVSWFVCLVRRQRCVSSSARSVDAVVGLTR
jgi:hypothetical protein